MFKLKKVVDERQELELLRIEHFGFWLLYWGLCISIIVQALFMELPFKNFAAEFIVFMLGSFIFLIACVKKGQWDYYTKPTIKTYLITSLIGSLCFTLLIGFVNYNKYPKFQENFTVFLISMAFIIVSMFVLIFVTSLILGTLVKRKQQKLEKEFTDDI